MGNKTLHVGFGVSASDRRRLTWGAGGSSARAPQWLRRAAQAGWANPRRTPAPSGSASTATGAGAIGQYEVAARGGLHLRKGPGLDWGITSTLPTGAVVSVLGFDGPNMDWARVDLEHDGLVDGHLFAAFLRPVRDDDFDDEGPDQTTDEHED
jgi:hypothetical protein